MDFPNPRRDLHDLVEMLAGELANDPSTPDALRVSSQMVTAEHAIMKKISAATRRFMLPLVPDCSEDVIREGKEYVEYLSCVTAGLDNFMAQYNKN